MKNKQRFGYVYTLTNTRTGVIFYIGSTVFVEGRLNAHIACVKHNTSPIYRSMKKMKNWPSIDILEEISFCDISELRRLENLWIEQFRQWGFKLRNVSGNLNKPKKAKKIIQPAAIINKQQLIDNIQMLTQKEAIRILCVDKDGLLLLVNSSIIKEYKVGGSAKRYKLSDIKKAMK
jgi:hypothetical protein